ncbi:MAG: type II/IV secretion system protein [Rhizobiales bacterium]|nr:type II/IV secretion system protein [Hyphomicrobiales bacterium]
MATITTATDFEDYLVSMGALTRSGTRSASARAPSYRTMYERGSLEPAAFAEAVASFHGLPRASLDTMRAGRALIEPFSTRFLREMGAFPYETPDGELRLGIADPSDTASLRAIELTLGRTCLREVAAFDEIELVLRTAIGNAEATTALANGDEISTSETWVMGEDDDLDSLRDMAAGAPVVRAVNEMFETAVEYRATDIHIEPFRGTLQVRLRVDGLLRQIQAPPADMARAIISRVKILAGLNIAERRLPQDGRARIRVGRLDLDLRVATMPTAHGEAAILRVLERNPRLLDLTRLGLGARDREIVSRHLQAPHGLIIVAGPTGSGKTTTLASALAMLNAPIRKILTIEDPIEYEIAGVNQSQVKPNIGLTFASALRAFLRQDPDVIMVGEMRDGETAKIGIQASLTGHLVLTTLHTNTAAASVTRLLDMGVEPFLLASTIRCIVGQRLVRVLCPDCRCMAVVDETRLAREPRFVALGINAGESVGEPVGCGRCAGSGYRGRQGVFEVLEVTDPIRRLIGTHADDAAIEGTAREHGMTTIIEDGLAKCRAGVTSVDEILRVTASR